MKHEERRAVSLELLPQRTHTGEPAQRAVLEAFDFVDVVELQDAEMFLGGK